MKPTNKPKLSHKLASIVMAGLASTTFISSKVFAGNATLDFSKSTEAMEKASSRIPNLITTTAFVAGLAMAIAGVFKIKAHVDNPAQAPLKDGLIRLAIGGALLAFPMLTNVMMGSIGGDQNDQAHLAVTKVGAITY